MIGSDKRIWVPLLVYSAFTSVVLWHLLLPGYVLTLDMVFTPNGPDIDVLRWFFGFETHLFGGLPFFLIVKGLNSFVPMWLIQKVILFSILCFAGLSAHYLCPSKNQIGKYFAGLLYMFNPFVYVRFVAGQWLFLLGYAFAPFAVKAMIDFFKQPTLRSTLTMTFCVTLVALFSPHILVLLLGVFMIFWLCNLVQRRGDRETLLSQAKHTALGAITFLILNLYWIVPALTTETVLGQIGHSDLYAFTARTGGTAPSILATVASMHAFWRSGYRYISDMLPVWYFIYCFILLFAIYGFTVRFKDNELKLPVVGIGAVAILSLILATGISLPYFSGFFEFLFDHLFFFRGLRDSQKFVALLALAYSYLGGIAVGELFGQIWRWKRPPAIVFSLVATAVVLVYSMNMFAGFNGRLDVRDYPLQWYETNDFLNQDKGDFNILFFPWHWYMALSPSEDVLLNPAGSFFDRATIHGENIEIGPTETQSPKPIQHYIHFLLQHKNEIINFGEFIAPLNVKYIILAKQADFEEYEFLYAQEDLRVVSDNTKLVLFENLHPIAKVYHCTGIYYIRDWEDLLPAFEGQDTDILDYTILVSDKLGSDQPSTFNNIPYASVPPLEYEVQVPERGFVILSEPYSNGWQLDDVQGVPNLGITNAFPVSGDKEYVIHYKRFNILLTLYLVSGFCLLGAVVTLCLMRKEIRRK